MLQVEADKSADQRRELAHSRAYPAALSWLGRGKIIPARAGDASFEGYRQFDKTSIDVYIFGRIDKTSIHVYTLITDCNWNGKTWR